MANRRANKKLRARARARMAATGERYQRALEAVRGGNAPRAPADTELTLLQTAAALALLAERARELGDVGAWARLRAEAMATEALSLRARDPGPLDPARATSGPPPGWWRLYTPRGAALLARLYRRGAR